MGILVGSKMMNAKNNVILIFLSICIIQIYRFSVQYPIENHAQPNLLQFKNPCQELSSHPENTSLHKDLLLHNCEPMLSRDHFEHLIFPDEVREQITDPKVFYDVALQKTSSKTTTKFQSADRTLITTLLEGDDFRKIQNIHFLCSYPNLIVHNQLSLVKS